MAKQSGLHQIRGKVGDFSYYKQSGVSAGIIRGINQGMSSRVKTGDEYANTRRNNKEFANACEIAASFGACVVPKWRPMFLTFSQAAIAKAVLSFIKEDDTTGTTWALVHSVRVILQVRWSLSTIVQKTRLAIKSLICK